MADRGGGGGGTRDALPLSPIFFTIMLISINKIGQIIGLVLAPTASEILDSSM